MTTQIIDMYKTIKASTNTMKTLNEVMNGTHPCLKSTAEVLRLMYPFIPEPERRKVGALFRKEHGIQKKIASIKFVDDDD